MLGEAASVSQSNVKLPTPVGVFSRAMSNRRRRLERVNVCLSIAIATSIFPTFAEDLDAIVARAEAAGIGRIVTISTRVKTPTAALLEIAERFPNVYCSVGTHPHQRRRGRWHSRQRTDRADKAFQRSWPWGRRGWIISTSTAQAMRRSAVFAPISPQRASRDCRWSFIPARLTKPVAASLRRRWPKDLFKAVLHCYTGGRELAMKAIFDGPCRFHSRAFSPSRNRDELCATLAAELPADRIMVETDSPYLAPGKFRGKRNEPSYVVEVAKVLAETRSVSLEEISRQTTENFFRLFSKVPAPKAAA